MGGVGAAIGHRQLSLPGGMQGAAGLGSLLHSEGQLALWDGCLLTGNHCTVYEDRSQAYDFDAERCNTFVTTSAGSMEVR
jgi:hypothetical protein